jgi:uncharacterized RDD family membrane protein YckC
MESGDILTTMPNVASQRSKPKVDRHESLASIGLRCGAFLIDYILTLLILAIPMGIAVYVKRRWNAPGVANTFLIAGYLATIGMIFFNWIYFYVQNGQSFGKSFIGLRVVRLDGEAIDYKTAILRHIFGYPLSALCLGLGMLWILWDAKQQGWHDKLAKTVVVKMS